MSINNAEHLVQPLDDMTPEIIEKIHVLLMEDKRLKVCEIVMALGISSEQV